MATNITIKDGCYVATVPPEFYQYISMNTLTKFGSILKNGIYDINFCNNKISRDSIVNLVKSLGGLNNNTVILNLNELCDKYDENLKKSEKSEESKE